MSKLYTLGRAERLKSRKAIELLFQQGKSFSLFPYKVYWLIDNGKEAGSSIQFGIGVGTRNFKKAVDRNRIKRLSREAYRLGKIPLEKLVVEKGKRLSLFFIYTGKEIPEFELVKEKITLILQKLAKQIDEAIKANT